LCDIVSLKYSIKPISKYPVTNGNNQLYNLFAAVRSKASIFVESQYVPVQFCMPDGWMVTVKNAQGHCLFVYKLVWCLPWNYLFRMSSVLIGNKVFRMRWTDCSLVCYTMVFILKNVFLCYCYFRILKYTECSWLS